MNLGRTVFSQLIAFLQDREFRPCVARYSGDYRPRGFSCWDQFLCMAFAQFTYRESPRDDPDARIAKMKDGRTHLAHKAEHAVDLSSGAVVAVTLEAADQGDAATIGQTLKEAQANAALVHECGVEEVVADKGYHSNQVLVELHAEGVRSYIPEPERGPRKWDGKEKEQQRVYANRRRVSGRHGKDLQKLRSELTERSFAHMYETGGMRRTHLRKRNHILKRLLFHAVGFNLALLLRERYGIGKPKTLQGTSDTFLLLRVAVAAFCARWIESADAHDETSDLLRVSSAPAPGHTFLTSTTGC